MQSLHFNTSEDLKDFLLAEDMKNLIHFVGPDYVKSIIGLGTDGKLIYSYTQMVEDLYLEYSEDESIEDPYIAAIEWVDCNIPKGFDMPHVVYDLPMEGLDSLFGTNGFENEITPYLNFCIGLNSNDYLIFDDDLCDDNKNKIIEITQKYKIGEPLFY